MDNPLTSSSTSLPQVILSALATQLHQQLLNSNSQSRREVAIASELLADELFKCQNGFLPAYKHLEDAASIFLSYKDFKSLARVQNKLGVAKFNMFDYNDAISHFKHQAEFSKKPVTQSVGLVNAGLLQLRLGNISDAAVNINQAFEIITDCQPEEPDRLPQLAYTCFVQGCYFVATGEHPQALKFHLMDLSNSTSAENSEGIMRGLTNVGLAHFRLKNYDEALTKFQSCVASCDDNNNSFSSYVNCRTHYHVATTYTVLGKITQAISHFDIANSICSESVTTQLHTLQEMFKNKVRLQEEAKKDAEENGDILPFDLQGEIPPVDETTVVAFGTPVGGVLHAQILHVKAIAHLFRMTLQNNKPVPCPDVTLALEAIQQSLDKTSPTLSPLARSAVHNSYGIISMVSGDWEKSRFNHRQCLKILESEKTFSNSNSNPSPTTDASAPSFNKTNLAGLMGASKAKTKLLNKLGSKKNKRIAAAEVAKTEQQPESDTQNDANKQKADLQVSERALRKTSILAMNPAK